MFSVTMRSGILLVTWQHYLWGQVRHEAVVAKAEDQQGETLIVDLCVHGVWLPRAEVLFDIHVINTDAQSYLHHTPSRVCLMLRLKRRISMLMPVLPDLPTLHPYVSMWMD